MPLIHKPHVSKCALVFGINFLLLLGLNTLRLWVPQIFAIFSKYEAKKTNDSNVVNSSLCHLLEEDVILSKQIEDHVPDVECVSVSIGVLFPLSLSWVLII